MNQNINRVFGEFDTPISPNVLPTHCDVVKAICYQRRENKITKKNAIKFVVKQVIDIWKSSGIPTVSFRRVSIKVETYYQKYDDVSKSDARRLNTKIKMDLMKVTFIE